MAPKAKAKTKAKANAAMAAESDDNVNLHRWVLSLSDAQLEKLVELLEQWNSNRRMASLAQMLFCLVLQAVPPAKLMAIEGMNKTTAAILSYSSRHMARVDALLQKTFLFDLVLQSSGFGLSLDESASGAGGAGPGVAAAGRAPAPEGAEAALRRTMEVLLAPNEDDEEVEAADEDDEDAVEAPQGTAAPVAVADNDASEEDEDEEAEVAPSGGKKRRGEVPPGKRKRAKLRT
mmetsp:Transcript_53578/g.121093  ORF Transcript_53578/g.121093 Transcript_53578/m.121093 type:complete len:233 (+) Transcript_53578:2-700(+)